MAPAFPESRLVETNGIRLELFEAGAGQPLVLCHGWPEHAYSWRHQIPALVAAGYRVLVPNQRGYGRSDRPADVAAYDIHHLCGDLVGLLDALELDQAIFVGHDWGAIVVWQLALLHPSRVRGLANLSVPFRPREPADPVAFWEQRLGPDFYIVHFNRQPGVAAAAFDRDPDRFLRNLYRTRQWLEPPRPARGIVEMAAVTDPPGELMMSETELAVFVAAFRHSGFNAPINWYRNFTRNWETTAGLEQKVSQSALMIYGRYDSVPQTPEMHLYVPDLEVHTLECGHWIQQEQPEQTNRLLLDWLGRRFG